MMIIRKLLLLAAIGFAGGIAYAEPTPETEASEGEPIVLETQPTERLVALAPSPDGSAARLDIDMEASGYVSIISASGENSRAIFFDGSGRQVGIGTARIAAPEGAYALVPLPVAAGPAALQVVTYPELDLTEPNDDALLAWPTDIGRANSALLFPAGDVDAYRISLPSDARIMVRIEQSPSHVNVQFIDPETETIITDGPIATLPAGETVIALSYSDGTAFSLDPVSFSIAQTPILPSADASAKPVLELGRPTIIGTPEQGRATFALEVTQPALYSLSASNVGANATINVTNSEGQVRSANWVHLAAGKFEIIIENIELTEAPAFITAYGRSAIDPTEPNDFSGDAAPVKLRQPTDYHLEWQVPVDWFSYTSTTDDTIFIATETLSEQCDTLEAGIAEPGDINGYEALPRTGNLSDLTFGPLVVTAGETVKIYLVCTDAVVDSDFKVTLFSSQSSGDSDSSIYLVGLELDEKIGGALAAAASAADVGFLEAEEAQTLDARIEQIARAETKSKTPWLFIILIGFAASIFAWFIIRRRKPNKPTTEHQKMDDS